MSVDEIFAATAVDPWFLDQMSMITEERAHLETLSLDSITPRGFKRAKHSASPILSSPTCGTSPRPRCGPLASRPGAHHVQDGRYLRRRVRGHHAVPLLDLRGHRRSSRRRPREGHHPRSGPNRIGQGIEFDYCCVHASFRCATPATRPSWSTAIPRPSRRTTTRPTGSTSSRSRTRTSWTSSTVSSPRA